MPTIIRPATPDDAAALVAAQIAAFHHDSVIYPNVELGGPPGYDSVERMREKIAQDECYTILVDDTCVGGIVLYGEGDDHVHLDVIFIDPAYHNQGIGTQAMAFIDAAHPAAHWTLDTPVYATRNHHFYEKFGYVNVGEHVYEGDNTRLYRYEKHPPP
jgi:GNAT superfamily N-acetyltransferase